MLCPAVENQNHFSQSVFSICTKKSVNSDLYFLLSKRAPFSFIFLGACKINIKFMSRLIHFHFQFADERKKREDY